MKNILVLQTVDLPGPAFDGVAFDVLHNENGFLEVAVLPTADGEPAEGDAALWAWLSCPEDVENLEVRAGYGQAVWQVDGAETRVVWRGLLRCAGGPARVYFVNRSVVAERSVELAVLLPDGRVTAMTVAVTRYVAPSPE